MIGPSPPLLDLFVILPLLLAPYVVSSKHARSFRDG
jgi:hypothetical protein